MKSAFAILLGDIFLEQLYTTLGQIVDTHKLKSIGENLYDAYVV